MKISLYRGRRVAILVPCYNEEAAIKQVVTAFQLSMPEAVIYVFDNNSSDRTAQMALDAGALVRQVALQGKGNVVRRMFADVEADIYLMVDGDATYHADSARLLVDKLIDGNLDMVVGCRVEQEFHAATYRKGHRFGNRLLTGSVMNIFGGAFTDMLSGYRAFSRRYVKSFPAVSGGFETETELTIHALELRMPYAEVTTPYGARPEGSESKLSTYRDGWRILKTIIKLYVSERPLHFFGAIGSVLMVLSAMLGGSIILEFIETHLVPRLPSAVLAGSMMVAGLLSVAAGFILDNVTRGRYEVKRLFYLATPGVKQVED